MYYKDKIWNGAIKNTEKNDMGTGNSEHSFLMIFPFSVK